MAIVNNIKEIREQRGIYQDELAEATGYCTKTIGRIERGESTPSAEFMLRISKYFNMMVEDVFHAEDWAGHMIPALIQLQILQYEKLPYKSLPANKFKIRLESILFYM